MGSIVFVRLGHLGRFRFLNSSDYARFTPSWGFTKDNPYQKTAVEKNPKKQTQLCMQIIILGQLHARQSFHAGGKGVAVDP